MGVFDNWERKLEGVVNDGFARAFKGDVQPVEIAARLQRHLDATAQPLRGDRKLVPNRFTVRLSAHDFARLHPYEARLNTEIVPQLREYAASAGYLFNAPVAVSYAEDAALPTGRFTVSAAADAAPPPAALALEVDGVAYPLTPPGVVIGRGADADIRINDPGLSRRHARFVVSGSPADPQVRVEDLGSTNGIRLFGQRVDAAPVGPGARLEMGHTRMLVRAGA